MIRLTPPELGTVRVELRERDGQITARLHADDPAVRQALERVLPQLRSDLRATDSPLQQITVDPSANTDRSFDGRGAWQNQQRQERNDAGGSGQRQRRGTGTPTFSLSGATSVEPIVTAPVRALGGRAGNSGVDVLA